MSNIYDTYAQNLRELLYVFVTACIRAQEGDGNGGAIFREGVESAAKILQVLDIVDMTRGKILEHETIS